MEQQWRIRIRGKQRSSIDIRSLAQAVLALGRQLQAEAAASDASPEPQTAEQAPAEDKPVCTETST